MSATYCALICIWLLMHVVSIGSICLLDYWDKPLKQSHKSNTERKSD